MKDLIDPPAIEDRWHFTDAVPCPFGGAVCGPGMAFLARLAAAMDRAAPVSPDLEMSGSLSPACHLCDCRLDWKARAGDVRIAGAKGMVLRMETSRSGLM